MENNKYRITDNFFELPIYDKVGNINKPFIFKIGMFITIFIGGTLNILMNYYLYIRDYGINSFVDISDWNFFLFYLQEYKAFIMYQIFSLDIDIEFLISVLISISISYFFIYMIYKQIEKLALIQRNISAVGLGAYYLSSYDKEDGNYIFKLRKGETINFEAFDKKRENLCQLFGFDSMEAIREGDNKVIVSFNDNFPVFTDTDIIELNKTIDKYNKEGYMTLGYSNVSDKGVVEEKVGKIYIKYLALKDLNIHMKLIGASGFGKSVNFATFLRNFMNSFKEIDTLFIHDFKGIESTRMSKFIQQSEQKEQLERRITTSTTIDELEDILIKLKIVYEYRRIVMSENNWVNYKGGKIIVMIDEFNIGMSALESKNKFEKKQAERVERMLKDFAMLYRAMNMYLIIVGQSNQAQDNWSSTLNKQTSIGFCLKSSNYVASAFCNEAYEKGINSANFGKGEVLFYNANNSVYFKFLATYLDENFLFDMGEVNIEPRIDIDNNMFKLAKQLEKKLIDENTAYYQKLLKANEIKEEEFEKQIEDFNEILTKNIEEISDYKFLVKEVDDFSFNQENIEEAEIIEAPEAIVEEEVVAEIIKEPSEQNIEQYIEQKKAEETEAEKITEDLVKASEQKRRFPKPNFKDIANKKIKENKNKTKETKIETKIETEIVLDDFSDLDEL